MIGSQFAERTDPAALVVGPTGLALGTNGELFVADTVNSRIAAIPDAATWIRSSATGLACRVVRYAANASRSAGTPRTSGYRVKPASSAATAASCADCGLG